MKRQVNTKVTMNPRVHVETEGYTWPHWYYEGGEWWNLMGMSWECVDPPDELSSEFREAEEIYKEARDLLAAAVEKCYL